LAPGVREGRAFERRHGVGVGDDGVAEMQWQRRRGDAQRRPPSLSGSTGFGAPGTVTGAGAR
jgi:hypothetical protein